MSIKSEAVSLSINYMESNKQVSGRFKETEHLVTERTVLGPVLFPFEIKDIPVNAQEAKTCSVC